MMWFFAQIREGPQKTNRIDDVKTVPGNIVAFDFDIFLKESRNFSKSCCLPPEYCPQ